MRLWDPATMQEGGSSMRPLVFRVTQWIMTMQVRDNDNAACSRWACSRSIAIKIELPNCRPHQHRIFQVVRKTYLYIPTVQGNHVDVCARESSTSRVTLPPPENVSKASELPCWILVSGSIETTSGGSSRYPDGAFWVLCSDKDLSSGVR